jgi:glutathione S-transferase
VTTALALYYHPLASFCWKVLIPLYENATEFEARQIDLQDEAQRAAFEKLSPHGKFPLLHDQRRGRLVHESTIIIEYLDQHHRGAVPLIPADPEAALEVRQQDRFFDQQVHEPMQKHVLDKLRPADKRDAFGVEQAHQQLARAYDLLENLLENRSWAAGEHFSMADCSAAPALYYANLVHPFTTSHPNVTAYLARLRARPSFARVLDEAQPYFSSFPG